MKTFVDAQIKHAPSNVKPRRAGRAINPLVTCAVIAFVGFLASIACAVPSFAQIVGTVQLNIERRGHTATLLEDGKVLIVGGDNQSGIVNQVELLDPASQTSSLAAMPIVARTDHTATRLADGRVFIIGGRDQNGSLTSTEIYHPLTATFTAGPSLTTPRSGHTATVLATGNILVAGGDASGSAELYNPTTQRFSLIARSMNTARKFQSAILLNNGQVLIAGGVGAQNNVLNTAEVYDPSSQSFYVPPTDMQTPRALAMLKLLSDGKVQVIGGDTELSMELFDPTTGNFNAKALLPPNADLLGATLSTQSRAALFTPSISQDPLLQGVLTPEQLALLDRADHSITELPSRNQALVAGGINSAGQILSSARLVSSSKASVTTDRTDYAPGETVTIMGSGFKPNEQIQLSLHEFPEQYPDISFSAVANQQGNFVATDFAPQLIDLDRRFTLTATGQFSGFTAQTAFTDAITLDSITVAAQSGIASFGTASDVSYAICVDYHGNNSTITFSVVSGLPSGVTPSFSANNITNPAKCNTTATTLTLSTTIAVPAGTYTFTVRASGGGTVTNRGTLVISKATPTATLAVSNSPQTYNGSSKAATVGITTSSVPGTVANILTGGAATQTAPGTYAVTADFVPNDTTNYNTLTGLSAGNFVIQKATPTATLAVNNSPQTYSGSSKAATVGITTSSVPGTVANILTGGAATQTAPGTYAVTADFVPNDTTNYNTLTGLSAGNFVIQKATPTATLAVNNSPQTYSGSPQAAVVTISASSVSGAVSNIKYDGSATVPTNAGTYAITADFVPNDTTNYNTLTGLSAGNFVIQKATPTATLAVNNSPQTYSGSPQAAVVIISASSVSGAVSNIKYDGSATVPTNAGTYAITADFVPNDTTNYNTLTGLSAGNFVIQKATPTATLAVNNSPQTYSGSPQAAVVTISASSVSGAVSNIKYDGSATVPTNAGTYAITADFVPNDTTNYNTLTGLSAGNFVIQKATPTATLAVNNSPQTYSGSPQAAVVIISASSVSGAVSNIKYDGSATVPTNAGTYAITADFVPNDTTNYNTLTGLSAGNFVIQKATPTATLAVNNSPQTYSGSPQAAVVIISASSVSGAVSNIKYDGSATVPTNAGTYAITADFVPNDTTNYNTLTGLSAGNFVIQKATPTATLAVNNSPQTYSGSPQAAVVTISASSVSGAVSNIKYDGSATVPTNAGTYAITADFVPNDTTNYNTLTGLSAGNFVIQKATPTATLAVNNSPQTYNGSPKAATVSITTNSVPGTVANIFTGGAATQTAAGSYAVTADFVPTDSANYNTLTGLSAGNFVIQKATPTATLAVNNSPQTYNGSPKAATVSITTNSVPGTVANILTGGVATQTAAGSYAVTADFVPTDSVNYNTLTGLSAGSFVIEKATATVSLNGLGTYIYDGTQKVVTATTNPSGLTVNITYSASPSTTTPPTAVGTYTVVGTISDPNYQGSATDKLVISPWTLKGFYQPVDMTTTPTIVWNSVKGGSTVPLKFNVFAGSIEQKSTTAVQSLSAQPVACSTGVNIEIDPTDLTPTGGTSLRYDTTGGQFIFNWQTPKPANVCYKVTMTTLDGSSLSAYFKSK